MLTFDDGPDPQNTSEILNILSREHVPATFFLIGENAARFPAIVNREIREGHVVSNHTLTHTDVGHGSVLDREELIGADRIIRGTAGYGTRLFRIPYGDPDNNPLAVLQAQQLGYTIVNYDLDTNDWQYKAGQNVPLPGLDGVGHVVLMHDGGADRAATIRLLPRLIAEAKAEGYTFTTVASLVPREDVPAHVTPSVADRFTLYGAFTVLVLPAELIGWLFWFGAGSLTIMSLIYVVLALVSRHRENSRHWPQTPGGSMLVSVALPAYNEEEVLAKTLTALTRTGYPEFEVVAVDDGSSDDTWGVLTAFASVWPRLRIFRQETNRGKAAALNYAIAQARGEIIVTLDGDTVFEPQTIGKLARHFTDPRLGVVAGQVKVGNRRNLLTAWQSLEYISGICVTRMAEGLVGAITIAPGACAAWRKHVILEAGGYSSQTLAEDCDLTLSIQRLGYKVAQDNEAISWTEAPMTAYALARQRLRWTFGNLQAFRKHRGMVLRPCYGILGMVVLRCAAVGPHPAGLHAVNVRRRRAEYHLRLLAGCGAVRGLRGRYPPAHVDRCDLHGAGTAMASARGPCLPADLRAAADIRAVPIGPHGGEGQSHRLVPAAADQHRLSIPAGAACLASESAWPASPAGSAAVLRDDRGEGVRRLRDSAA